MQKQLIHKNDIQKKIMLGLKEISKMVKRTLGPGGLPIILERSNQQALDGSPMAPQITKDGVTVAEECFNSDAGTDLIIQTVKAICRKTNKVVGDGTTTAIVLGEAILNNAFSELNKDPKLNPQFIREQIEESADLAKSYLEKLSRPIEGFDSIKEVATISSNGDEEVGEIIQEAFEAVGSEGVITIDEGYSNKTTIDVVNGFQIERGAEGQDRFFNNKDRTRFEAENVHVILYDGNLNNHSDLIPALEAIKKNNKNGLPPILVVANAFSPEVILFLTINKVQGGLSVCAVQSPHMTTVRTGMLDDMAIMLGGTRFGNGNKNLNTAVYEDVGVCNKVVASKRKTTFYGGAAPEEVVIKRVDQLKASKEEAESPYDASLIADRIAGLSQGIAKIGVGGTTEFEIKEKYYRIEDALNAARAALEEGVIDGGGAALLRVATELEKKNTVGNRIIAEALREPFIQILDNVGIKQSEIYNLIDEVLLKEGSTYDARNRGLVDAKKTGIIDPLKVAKTALDSAVSIAALLTTCGGGIVFKRKSQ